MKEGLAFLFDLIILFYVKPANSHKPTFITKSSLAAIIITGTKNIPKQVNSRFGTLGNLSQEQSGTAEINGKQFSKNGKLFVNSPLISQKMAKQPKKVPPATIHN